jgi:hypothetical protein
MYLCYGMRTLASNLKQYMIRRPQFSNCVFSPYTLRSHFADLVPVKIWSQHYLDKKALMCHASANTLKEEDSERATNHETLNEEKGAGNVRTRQQELCQPQ